MGKLAHNSFIEHPIVRIQDRKRELVHYGNVSDTFNFQDCLPRRSLPLYDYNVVSPYDYEITLYIHNSSASSYRSATVL